MTQKVEPVATYTGEELYSRSSPKQHSVRTMHFDVLSCTHNMILINPIFLLLLLPYSFGFCYYPLSAFTVSIILSPEILFIFVIFKKHRTIPCRVFHVVGLLSFDFSPHGCTFMFCPTVRCDSKHPCNHFLRTDSWSPQGRGKTGADWGPLKTGTVPVTL